MTDINLDKIKQLDAKYRENISEIEKSYSGMIMFMRHMVNM
jgi:hypothetical protein